MPSHTINYKKWSHISLADPTFGPINLLLAENFFPQILQLVALKKISDWILTEQFEELFICNSTISLFSVTKENLLTLNKLLGNREIT